MFNAGWEITFGSELLFKRPYACLGVGKFSRFSYLNALSYCFCFQEGFGIGPDKHYETFPEFRKQANRRKSGGIIRESTPSRSEAREDVSSLPTARD